jgi:hypothetical protein
MKSDILDQPCQIHTKKDEEGNFILPKHTTRECRLLKQELRQEASRDKDEDDDDRAKGTSGHPNVENVLTIFADNESKSHLKVINREVNMAVPTVTKFLDWAKTPVTFDQSDHPAHIPTPGRQALVVDPVVGGVRLRKVLMDGGSGLNIIYTDTLEAMGIPMTQLSKSNMQFHGVIPGKKAKSLGQIALDVVFGEEKNL